MARKKATNAKQLSLDLKPGRDERRIKIVGLAAMLFAVYLFIAYTSYLITWYMDQDLVLQHGIGILWNSEVVVDNWLGKLGALVSNFMVYHTFGVLSIILIYQLFRWGFFKVMDRKSSLFWPQAYRAGLFTALLSVYAAFICQNIGFPFGGAFGNYVSAFLIGVLGQVGMMLLLITVVLAFVVWYYNPDFNKFGLPPALSGVLSSLKGRVDALKKTETTPAPGNPSPKKQTDMAPSIELSPIDLQSKPEKPDTTIKRTIQIPELELAEQPESNGTPAPAQVPELLTTPASLEHGTHPVVLDNEAVDTEPYDPTRELSRYKMPDLELLHDYSTQQLEVDRTELEQNKDQILQTLMHYKIEITKIRATIGPTVTLYEIVPAPGIKISRIRNLEDDIALSLSALGIRIIAPIPGKGTIGIEVPNKKKQIVGLREVLASEKFKNARMELPIALGKTISNEVFVADLARMPHLLIAGATGQGKSVGINSVLISLLYRKHPAQLKLVLIDPKKVELYPYGALENHFLAFLPEQTEPIVTDNNHVIYTLNSLCLEMDARYLLLQKAKTRNLREYNDKFTARRLSPREGHRYLPFIVLVIDEFADLILTAGREVEQPLARLAQLARAVGIHLVIATQRPSVNIITGSIKANFPARIAFKVASKIDSRTILDSGGADQLIGQGDMLLSVGGDMIRLQGAFVDTSEVEKVISFVGDQQGFPEPHFLPEYNPDNPNAKGPVDAGELDELYKEAARIIVSNNHGSTSMIQRRLKLGYNRAGRIMDQLEAIGIVGPAEGSKPREVLFHSVSELEQFLDSKFS